MQVNYARLFNKTKAQPSGCIVDGTIRLQVSLGNYDIMNKVYCQLENKTAQQTSHRL